MIYSVEISEGKMQAGSVGCGTWYQLYWNK